MGIVEIIKIKFSKITGKVVSTDEMLDYAFDEQRKNVKQAKLGMSELVTARKQFEKQRLMLITELDSHTDRARRANDRGDLVLAEKLIGKKIDLSAQIAGIDKDIAQTVKDEETLMEKISQLETNLRSIRVRNEKLKTQSKVAETRVKANEIITGMSKNQIELSSMIDKTIDKTAENDARADALEELASNGVFIETGFSTEMAEMDPEERAQKIKDELAKLSEEKE